MLPLTWAWEWRVWARRAGVGPEQPQPRVGAGGCCQPCLLIPAPVGTQVWKEPSWVPSTLAAPDFALQHSYHLTTPEGQLAGVTPTPTLHGEGLPTLAYSPKRWASVVADTCNTSCLGSRDRRMAVQGQPGKISTNFSRLPLFRLPAKPVSLGGGGHIEYEQGLRQCRVPGL